MAEPPTLTFSLHQKQELPIQCIDRVRRHPFDRYRSYPLPRNPRRREEDKQECCRLFILQKPVASADNIVASNNETKRKIEQSVKRHECAGNIICDSLQQQLGHRMENESLIVSEAHRSIHSPSYIQTAVARNR